MTLAEAERDYILHVLRSCDYNRAQTARILDISVRGLRIKLNLYRDQGHRVDFCICLKLT
ncbi:MAG: helix-turn-helix domain-containing protein [Bdellovibrio sp.]|nr:helix-turn-helix domain-containing protein [Bdellovibrio sp.]